MNPNTSNITNNVTRHNNYEHNVTKNVHTHIKHINNYDNEVNYYSRKPLNNKQYYNSYNDNFNFRKIENTPLTRQTDITNDVIETTNQIITYADNNYLNNSKIATIIVNPTPSLTDNYLWIPEGITDDVVPGVDSLLAYIQSKYATLATLQNSTTNINVIINNEIQNLQTEINDIEITPSQNVRKESHYYSSNTDFWYQRNIINNDNRKHIVLQNH